MGLIRTRLGMAVIVIILFLLVLPVLAQIGGNYDLSWWTIDSGGGSSTGDGYALSGSVGQPDAGQMSGGPYTVTSGFWSGSRAELSTGQSAYLPFVIR